MARNVAAHGIRPRLRRKQARPSEIIDAGLAEFGEKGFAAARLDDIARRAGISKGTIYLYFDSKEAVFEAALKAYELPLLGEAEALLSQYPGPTRDLLTMLLQRIYGEIHRPEIRTLIQILLSDGRRFPRIAEVYFEQSVRRGRAMLEKVVARGVERGEFRHGPASDMPMIVIAPMIMSLVWTITFNRFEPLDLDRFLKAHLDLLFHGLEVRPT